MPPDWLPDPACFGYERESYRETEVNLVPLEVVTDVEAIASLKSNPLSLWPARGTVDSRLEPIARPGFAPGFSLVPGEPIFTIGSCFARNVENSLAARGYVLPTRDVIRTDPAFGAIGFNILNNYGAPSIHNELSWALEPSSAPAEEDIFFEIYPGQLIDIHLNHALRPAPIDLLRSRRAAIANANRRVSECRVVIITLGLSEVWYDTKTGFYVNTSPRRSNLRKNPGRFVVRVMSYAEVIDYLRRTIELLKSHAKGELNILLTVSPVPLQATYRSMDIFTASTYSKSVLRAAAEEITMAYDFIDYYPSYESIILSERGYAWEDDNVHPTKEVVEINCERMVRAYTAKVWSGLTVDSVKEGLPNWSAQKLFGSLENRLDLVAADEEISAAFCKAAIRLQRADLARTAAQTIGSAQTDEQKVLLLAEIAELEGDPRAVIAMLTDEPVLRRNRIRYRALLTRAHADLGDLVEAKQQASLWSSLNHRSAEPFRVLGRACARAGEIARADNYFRQALEKTDDDPALLLDYVEHLERSGRRAEAETFLAHIDPQNPSHNTRLERLHSDLVLA